ncbi:MAG: hypothetical protein IT384_22490 [Deltaproteobacteria bacterium]|nr:hypothetical protein [Deltaproteobacteria bacterium]
MRANPKSIGEAELLQAFSKSFGSARAEDVRRALREGTLTVDGLLETIRILHSAHGPTGEASAVLRAAKPATRLDRKLAELAAGVTSLLEGAALSDTWEDRALRFSRPRSSSEGGGLAACLSLEGRGKRIHVRIEGCDAAGSWSFDRKEGARVLSTIQSVWDSRYATGVIGHFLSSEGALK